jgi:hypothetical protein
MIPPHTKVVIDLSGSLCVFASLRAASVWKKPHAKPQSHQEMPRPKFWTTDPAAE